MCRRALRLLLRPQLDLLAVSFPSSNSQQIPSPPRKKGKQKLSRYIPTTPEKKKKGQATNLFLFISYYKISNPKERYNDSYDHSPLSD